MNVKDVIKLACVFVQKEDYLTYSTLDGDCSTVPDSVTKDIDRLVRCYNIVSTTVASDYLQLIYEETIKAVDNKVNLSSLTKTPLQIKNVKTTSNEDLPFMVRSGSIYVATDCDVVITYAYLPSKLTITDDIDDYFDRLSAQVLAYGVASEYCLISSLFEETAIWDNRFKNSLLSAMRNRREMKIPKRRW